MEYAKDEVFNIVYNDARGIKRKRTSSIGRAIKKNKLIGLIIGITIILCITNIIFIYNFFTLLLKI